MFSTLKFRWQLRSLFAEQDRMRKIFKVHLAKARRSKAPRSEIEALNSEAWHEETMINDEIALLVTQFWLRRANRLFVPAPARTEEGMWQESQHIERWVLTEKGISAVRTAVREEERAKREFLAYLGSGIIGVVGAVTGLVAVWKD